MNKYAHINPTFSSILTHEIGHIIIANHYGIEIETITINRTFGKTTTKHVPEIDTAFSSINTNFCIAELEKHEKILWPHFIRLVAGDVMVALNDSGFVFNEQVVEQCLLCRETKLLDRFSNEGFVRKRDVLRECAEILISKKQDFYIWKLILLKSSRKQQISQDFSNMMLEYNKFLGRSRHQRWLCTRLALPVLQCWKSF